MIRLLNANGKTGKELDSKNNQQMGSGQLNVVKIGGNVIDDEQKLAAFLKEFSSIKGPKVLVHGGGKLATRVATALGIEQQMVEGRRITDAETLKVVTMVYAGFINKNIVAALQSYGCNAIGLSGADGNAVLAHKRGANSVVGKAGIDYGFAGDVDAVNAPLLEQLLNQGYSVVLAPITHDGRGQLLNTNADTIASTTAVALAQYFNVRLIYCFEKKGVLENVEDDNSVISEINQSNYQQLKKDGKLFAGILPKIDNAFAAIDAGVKEVLIGHADDLDQNTGDSLAGTLIKL
jgi:acetylglutamate kinase